MKTNKILFVDDEMQILKSVKRLFMDTDYDVIITDSGEKALEIMDKNEIDLIITDMRMPNMDGYQLLEKVKSMYTNTMRIILSGYSDESTVFKAIQKNLAKVYIFKPWDNENLLKTIDRVFETERILKAAELIDTINSIDILPTIPEIYEKINELIEKDADIKEIAELIEKDQSMASKVLHIANSAYFGGKTGSLRQAIIYVGTSNLKELILSAGIVEKLSLGKSGESYNKILWQHSYIVNKLSMSLYERIFKRKIPAIAMSAGLLHDIGRVVMAKTFKNDYYEAIIKSANNGLMDLLAEETKRFRFSHQEYGGYLLKWWEFPTPIIEAALYHHNPLSDNIISKDIVAIVHLADYYSWIIMNKSFNERNLEREVFDYLNFSEQECIEFIEYAKNEYF